MKTEGIRYHVCVMAAAAAGSVLSVAAGIGLALLIVDPAYPHDALPTASQPQGWSYGYECCHSLDCSRVEGPADITTTPEGYRIERTGEVIGYQDRRIKRSRDEYYHRCTPGGNLDAPRSLCLYVPDMAF